MWEFKFKRKPKPEFKEKAAYVPQTQEHAPGLPRQLTTYHNRVSDVFNDYCHEMGVQVSIGMNPGDYNRQMALKVVGDRDVQVEHRGKITLLGPGESLVISISDTDVMSGRTEEYLPKLTLLPYGNAAAQQNAGMCADIGGWQNYRVHQGATLPCTQGINRQFFQYGKLSGLDDEQKEHSLERESR